MVAVDNESGEKVGFAEDDAIGIGVADQRLSIADCIGNALAEQSWEVRDRLRREKADRYLGGAGVESCAERLAPLIGDGDERSGLESIDRENIGAVDPDVARFEADGAAGGDCDFRETSFFACSHEDMVKPHEARTSPKQDRMRCRSTRTMAC